jgi:YidC/Oxa1 family membrane protein insertase
MDKKHLIIGVGLIGAAFASLYVGSRLAPQPPATPAAVRKAVAQQEQSAATTTATGTTDTSAPVAAPALTATGPQANFAAATGDNVGAQVTTLENDFIRVRFTDFGGAVRDIALKKYPAAQDRPDPFVFNELHADPMLALTEFPGLDRGTRYTLVSSSPTEIIFRAILDGRLEVTRHYTLPPSVDVTGITDPYQLRHETTFRNLTEKTAVPLRVALALGTAAPINALDYGIQLKTGYHTPDTQKFIPRSQLEGGGFLANFGIGSREPLSSVTSPGPILWASVKNQFFTSILTPDAPAASLVTRRVKLLTALPDIDHNAYGIAGAAQFERPALAAGASTKLGSNFYVGPKEYKRLANGDVFKADQDKVMDYGFFGWASKLLVTLMTWMHSLVGNWGFAIMLTTLALKIAFVPLTLASTKSMKRMAKLQPELAALKVKFKDNPQKQQQATMALFKERKVNPVGGCLPQLLTIPFFMGFYSMLSSTAELRFAPFLWAQNLAAPDTLFHLGPIPVNVLPLLLGVTMLFQMRLTPTSPTMDSTQAAMMKFMPVIFTFFCYSLPAALSLYSTTNGLFTIAQQLLINRMKDEEVPVAAVTTPGGKPVKNVTPVKKKK